MRYSRKLSLFIGNNNNKDNKQVGLKLWDGNSSLKGGFACLSDSPPRDASQCDSSWDKGQEPSLNIHVLSPARYFLSFLSLFFFFVKRKTFLISVEIN